MDYLFRWLALRFPVEGTSPLVERHPAARTAQLDLPKIPLLTKDFISVEVKGATSAISVVDATAPNASGSAGTGTGRDRAWVQESDAPPCHECGTLMVRNGACHKCPNCGSTSGCS